MVNGRNRSVDAVKGILIFLVVIGHVLLGTLDEIWTDWPDRAIGAFCPNTGRGCWQSGRLHGLYILLTFSGMATLIGWMLCKTCMRLFTTYGLSLLCSC